MNAVVAVTGIAAGGDGVGRLDDGRVAFVPRTAPGDVVEADLEIEKPRWVRGRVRRITAPGRDRVVPECPHYEDDECGGCQLQHLSESGQVEAKRRIVGDALRRIGGLDLPDPDLEPAPTRWRYRRKVTFARPIGGGSLGFRRYGRPDETFEVRDCHIATGNVNRVWAAAGPACQGRDDVSEAVVREDDDGVVHVSVAGAKRRTVRELAGQTGVEAVWWWHGPNGMEAVAGGRGGFPPPGFEQAHPVVAARIQEEAVDGLQPRRGELAWDLYAGVGAAARDLASRGVRVTAVERDPRAVAAAERANGGDMVDFRCGDVERAVPELEPADFALVNPPRSGLSRITSTLLDGWGAGRPGARMAYVSCDPATLARDLTRMPCFTVVGVRAFDLFPQTAHVETVVQLRSEG